MKAYDLMKLAAENPQKYEGKRYRSTHALIDPNGMCHSEFMFDSEGRAIIPSVDNWAYINSNTKVKEIKQSVPFMEAVKAYSNGETIWVEWERNNVIYEPKRNSLDNPWLKDNNGRPITADEILRGKWYIK